MGVKSKITQVVFFCVLNIILSTWIWHLSLDASADQESQDIKETILKSFISSALNPLSKEVKSISHYIMPSLLQPMYPMLEPDKRQINIDISRLKLHEQHRSDIFATYTGVYIDGNGVDIVAVVPHNARPEDGGHCVLTQSEVVDACRVALHEYNINKYSEVMMDIGNINSSFSPADCSYIQDRLERAAQTKHDTLVVFTTCNHLEMTVMSINSLKRSRDQFDILVVDDFSVDGTAEYLIKQGFAVITKDRAYGLTHSWNVGYRVAKHLGYKYVIFTNNDVLVPRGAIDMTRKALPQQSIVVPLTTDLGAGHNPAQSLMYSHEVSEKNADYVNDPIHADLIQRSLVRMANRASHHLVTSKWNNRTKFNGFFFAVNIAVIQPSAFDSENLFDPDAVMVDQEDRLVKKMLDNKQIPRIFRFVFVYHFKSVTVKASKYVMGSKIETRNNLLLYHPELNSSRAITQVSYPALYSHYMEKMRLPATNLYPNDHRPIVIGMAVSNRRTHPAAGDIFTARELGNSLSSLFDVKVVYLDRGPGWYADTSELDILVAFLDAYEVPLVKLARPSLIVVAWMRNWFHRWLSKQWIGNFDMILVSSSVAAAFYMSFPTLPVQCHERCPPALALHRRRLEVHVDTLRIATNPLRFSPGAPSSKFRADYVFTGSYWEAHRDVMDFNPLNISEFKGVVIGANWHRAPVSKAWLDMVHGEVPYRLMPEIYRSSKIVIDDANHVTKPWGSVNSRVFDALACGTLVLTNGALGSEDTFDLELPTYTDMDDLTEKLRYFLTHDSAREELAKKLQQQVLSRHTYRNRAEEFASSVNNLFKQQVIKRLKVDLDNSTTSATLYTDDDHIIRPSETIRMSAGEIVSHSPNEKRVDMSCVEEETPAICVGVRTYAGAAENYLEVMLQSLLLSHSSSQYRHHLNLLMYVVNTDNATVPYLVQLEHTIDRVNTLAERCAARIFWDPNAPARTRQNSLYGYDVSDMLLDYLRDQEKCQWIMFTNGDNLYNKAWFSAVVKHAIDPMIQVIGWDFVSHHPRDGSTEQVIRVEMKRKFVDLGSVMIRNNCFRSTGVHFLPLSVFTRDMFARDYFTITGILSGLQNASTQLKLLHRVLLLHQ